MNPAIFPTLIDVIHINAITPQLAMRLFNEIRARLKEDDVLPTILLADYWDYIYSILRVVLPAARFHVLSHYLISQLSELSFEEQNILFALDFTTFDGNEYPDYVFTTIHDTRPDIFNTTDVSHAPRMDDAGFYNHIAWYLQRKQELFLDGDYIDMYLDNCFPMPRKPPIPHYTEIISDYLTIEFNTLGLFQLLSTMFNPFESLYRAYVIDKNALVEKTFDLMKENRELRKLNLELHRKPNKASNATPQQSQPLTTTTTDIATATETTPSVVQPTNSDKIKGYNEEKQTEWVNKIIVARDAINQRQGRVSFASIAKELEQNESTFRDVLRRWNIKHVKKQNAFIDMRTNRVLVPYG